MWAADIHMWSRAGIASFDESGRIRSIKNHKRMDAQSRCSHLRLFVSAFSKRLEASIRATALVGILNCSWKLPQPEVEFKLWTPFSVSIASTKPAEPDLA